MTQTAIPLWAIKRAQDFLDANDPREGVAHGNLAAWIPNALAGYIALHEDEPSEEGEAQMASKPLCPDTVRACIEALPKNVPGIYKPGDEQAIRAAAIYDCARALEALLTKPDPAEAVVDEWEQSRRAGDSHATSDFARWLIETGRIKP